MLRRRSTLTIVAITAIVAVLVTVGVVYAVQQIFGTRDVSAKVKIVSAGEFLRVCQISDTSCTTLFTGDLAFDDAAPAGKTDARFFIKNTASTLSANNILIDGRIRFNNVATPLSLVTVGLIRVLSGDVPNLGKFIIERYNASGASLEHIDQPLIPQSVKQLRIIYTASPTLIPPQTISFDILVDVVDVVE